tara:strand:+ start:383 stop:574 length:192 start_codon:yes stop_codon:yes gene_type:complete
VLTISILHGVGKPTVLKWLENPEFEHVKHQDELNPPNPNSTKIILEHQGEMFLKFLKKYGNDA